MARWLSRISSLANERDSSKIQAEILRRERKTMIIKRLELQGFKSFPDRTKIVFHPGITAVVGPNGTGKSNLIDAILWVLGGQRQKALRGEKTEDIIFNGNNKRPALSLAEVIMTLEEGNEELVISHRLFRSGESEYRLNGKLVRLKDIQDTLWKKEVAEKDYFVIEQGSIGLLLTSKPQEKRQLLEEAAGTAFYKEKKKQAQSKLESSEQNLTRLEDIIAEVARAKNSLARQAAAAQRYRRLRERCRELRTLVYLKKLNQLEERRREINTAYQQCLQEENELVAQIKKAEKEISSLRNDWWELSQWLEASREELHNLETKKQRLETEKETRRVEYLEERKKQAGEEVTQLEEEKEVVAQELHLTRMVEADLEKSLQERRGAYDQAKQEWEKIEKKRQELGQSREQARDHHLNLLSRLTEAKNEASRLEKEMELSGKQERRLREQIAAAHDSLARLKERIDKIQEQIDSEEKAKISLETALKEKEAQLKELAQQLETVQRQVEERQKKCTSLVYEIQALGKLREQASGEGAPEIPESLGRLLDLIKVDSGFGRLTDMFLREAAEATVVPAEAILNQPTLTIKGQVFLLAPPHPSATPSLPSHPEIIGFLKSHLHPQEPLAASWAQFPEAVIVTNLRAAVELWVQYPDFNFITLQGEVLTASGFLRVEETKEGLFALQEELHRCQEELAAAEKELKPWLEKAELISQEKQQLENLVSEAKQELLRLEKKLRDMDRERGHLKIEEAQLLQNNELFQKELSLLLTERQEIQTRLHHATETEKRLSEEEIAAKEKVLELEKALAEEDAKLNLQTRAVMELKALLEIDEEKKRHVKQQVESLEQRLTHISQKIQGLQTQISAWEQETQELRRKILQIGEELKSWQQLIEKKRREINEAESRYAQWKQEDEAKEKWLQETREAWEQKKEERVHQEILRAEIDRDLANLEENCWQELRKTLTELQKEAPQKEMFEGEVEAELNQAEEELQKFKAVNLMAEEEYQQQKERYNFLLEQRNDLRASIQSTREAIEKIDEESKNQFLRALEEVNRHFQEVFSILFRGGMAEVKLTDPTNPLESGAEIMAQPPGKKVQNITLLSGGEKSLTSLAFLFALFRTRPTPFCILDEVDAALDENNLSRFLDLMETMKHNTQFIIVTHNYKTMEVADYIYGTTMDEPNVSRLYSVRLEKKPEATSPS